MDLRTPRFPGSKEEFWRQKIVAGISSKKLYEIPDPGGNYVVTPKGFSMWKRKGSVDSKDVRFEIHPSGKIRAVRWK